MPCEPTYLCSPHPQQRKRSPFVPHVPFHHHEGRQQTLLSPLMGQPAKADGPVNGGAYAPFILTVDWPVGLCYSL